MIIEGLDWTNLWLGILAVVSLIQFLIIAAVGLFAFQMYRKAMTVVDTIEQRHVRPLRAKVEALIAEAQLVVDKGKDVVERVKGAEETVADALKHAASAGSQVVGSVRSKAWPILGIIQGVRMAVKAMMNGRSTHHDQVRPDAEAARRYAGSP